MKTRPAPRLPRDRGACEGSLQSVRSPLCRRRRSLTLGPTAPSPRPCMACTRKPAGIPTGSGRVAYEFCRWLEPSLSTNEPDIFGILDSVMRRLRRRRDRGADGQERLLITRSTRSTASTSPDGTITIEQHAKIAVDGSYTWQFWARRGDKLTLLKPEQPDYAAGFEFTNNSQWLVRMQKTGAGEGGFVPLSPGSAGIRWRRPESRWVIWRGPTSRAYRSPQDQEA